MKETLLLFVRRMAISLIVLTVMIGSLLSARGELYLIGALFLGYAASLVFIWNMAYRLWRIAGMAAGAKKNMLWGFILRLMVLFMVLLFAVQISSQVFGIVALGFILCYGCAIVQLIIINFSKN